MKETSVGKLRLNCRVALLIEECPARRNALIAQERSNAIKVAGLAD